MVSGSDESIYWILTGRNYKTVTDLPNRNHSTPNLRSLFPSVVTKLAVVITHTNNYESSHHEFHLRLLDISTLTDCLHYDYT
jgi:hypothetical protein